MQRPYISTNLAISADGKITSVERIPSGWTSKDDHALFMRLRESADALLVGRGTLESDHMTLRVPGKSTQPLRCIVSQRGKLDPAHPVFQQPGGDIHLLITGEHSEKISPELIPKITVHRHSLMQFLEILTHDYHVQNLHCEGGGQLIHAMAELDVIDEFHLTLAGHRIFGGRDASTATGSPAEFLAGSREFELSRFEPRPDIGECFLTYTRRR